MVYVLDWRFTCTYMYCQSSGFPNDVFPYVVFACTQYIIWWMDAEICPGFRCQLPISSCVVSTTDGKFLQLEEKIFICCQERYPLLVINRSLMNPWNGKCIFGFCFTSEHSFWSLVK